MRKIATYLSAIVLLTACITNNRQNNRILYVSIQPLQSLVDSIVGGDFEVEVLVPAGASPETFEPTPRQFVELNEAQLIFNVGLIDFETSLLGKVEQQEKVIDLSHGIDLIEGSCSHSSHGHNHTHGVDPHVWISPKALQKMATNAFEAIRKAYPDSVKYETNYNRLQKELQARRRKSHGAASNISSSTTPPSPIMPATTGCGRSPSKQTVRSPRPSS